MKTLMKAVFVLAAIASLAMAADKPNFSGNWKLDIDKSTFGPIPPPTSMTRKIDHSDPAVTVEEAMSGAQGDQNSTRKYATDGKETTNQFMGQDVKSTGVWDGSALKLTTKADFGGTEVTLVDKWTLSDDGKVFTDVLHIVSPQGEFDITYILNKQ
jgi:hypothetical protein